jgi:hypothetical protein
MQVAAVVLCLVCGPRRGEVSATALLLLASRVVFWRAARRNRRMEAAGDIPAHRPAPSGAFAPAVGKALAVPAPRVVEPAREAVSLRLGPRASLERGAELGKPGGLVDDRDRVEEGVAEVGFELVGGQFPFAAPADRCGGFQGRCSPAVGGQRCDEAICVVAGDAAPVEANHGGDPNAPAAETSAGSGVRRFPVVGSANCTEPATPNDASRRRPPADRQPERRRPSHTGSPVRRARSVGFRIRRSFGETTGRTWSMAAAPTEAPARTARYVRSASTSASQLSASR